MASEVDIANLALAHLGDNATVASLDPPEGSAQAEHCARFYPIARDSMLEMHTWKFSTKRVQLAELTSEAAQWDYCYAKPADLIKIIAVLPPNINDDLSLSYTEADMVFPFAPAGQSLTSYAPQDYSAEALADGTEVIYTDQEDATLRYSARVTDPTKFSPLFVNALSWHLASMLAGPIIKGDAGAAEAKRCAAMMQMYLSQAILSDANQRQARMTHAVQWMAGR